MNHVYFKRLALAAGVIGLLLAISVPLAGAAPAAPSNQANATLTEDFWCNVPTGTTQCDATKNNTNFLRLQASLGAATNVGIVRVNFTDVNWQIGDARLNMTLGYVGSCVAEPVNIQVYEATDTDPPARGALLASIDGGTAQVPFPGANAISEAYQHWTDTTIGDGLVQYLETQRAGDGVATLWLQQTAGTGSIFLTASNNPAGANTSCGTGAGGSYSLEPPVLQLADIPQPLAVNVAASSATRTTSPFYLGLVAVALFVVAGVMISRRRTA